MHTRRQQIKAKAAEIAAPILAEMGLELVEVDFSTRDREQVLCLYLDRPGGVTVDELQRASRTVEKALEVAEIVIGRYRLEVSSPGIDRPWKKLSDYQKNLGSRVYLKLIDPLPDGRRHLKAKLIGIEEEVLILKSDEGVEISVPFGQITSARPEIDWDEMMKGTGRPASNASLARRTS